MSTVSGNTFLPVLRRLAEIDPDRSALTCGDVTLTRAGFVARAERLAALFAARGVTEGSTVTIGLPNSIGFVESMFAAWAVGAVPQPVPPGSRHPNAPPSWTWPARHWSWDCRSHRREHGRPWSRCRSGFPPARSRRACRRHGSS